ncbi:MAG TPA: polymer-forming cytoskeletal protein [Rectinema sp.]|jgi:cytoskeletal protein CcmA (bactofilin family)|nr:MAG: Polymer-forming cytoskeletal [Spirochaetes bacterium ADurb.Bin110]HOE76809.1 polymer-forming cytoskeletal protein [Rectinema sp.]HOU61920.1 polymer-forming cytoskeletal protein [Rectinema sp.]HPB62149.1 polymer-forming cytoskeletal protein [Rectinema sp.]HPW47637.1 polymer-forming cytoskeletal protein [Rectinema sp.]
MKEKNNLTKAFDELLHGKSYELENEQPSIDAAHDPDPQPSAAQLASLAASTASPARQSSEATITADMVIRGTICSASNINVFGTVFGDVSCENDMIVSGKIEGNISARSLQLLSGAIIGDIEARSIVEIVQGSTVNGNISAERIAVDSRVIGNLNAAALVRLNANAVIDGNIKSGSLAVQEGCQLKGNVDIHKAEEGEST